MKSQWIKNQRRRKKNRKQKLSIKCIEAALCTSTHVFLFIFILFYFVFFYSSTFVQFESRYISLNYLFFCYADFSHSCTPYNLLWYLVCCLRSGDKWGPPPSHNCYQMRRKPNTCTHTHIDASDRYRYRLTHRYMYSAHTAHTSVERRNMRYVVQPIRGQLRLLRHSDNVYTYYTLIYVCIVARKMCPKYMNIYGKRANSQFRTKWKRMEKLEWFDCLSVPFNGHTQETKCKLK